MSGWFRKKPVVQPENKAPSVDIAPLGRVMKCPMCGENALKLLLASNGELWVNRMSVAQLPKPVTNGTIMGGPNFLMAFRLCHKCGFVAIINLTLLGHDQTVG